MGELTGGRAEDDAEREHAITATAATRGLGMKPAPERARPSPPLRRRLPAAVAPKHAASCAAIAGGSGPRRRPHARQ